MPTPQRLSEPTPRFSRPWVIATWVSGEPADGAEISNVGQALDSLARFLRALHQPAPDNAPTNPWRSVRAAADFLSAYGVTMEATVHSAQGWAVLSALDLISIGQAWERGLPGGQPTWGRAGRRIFERVFAFT
ncbi:MULTISPECIES: hypothetical protein [Streptomyces]|uniref:hypothetical protein n=1 Tax=Streptomyces TaxID=1883 RepID=UPI003B8A78B5